MNKFFTPSLMLATISMPYRTFLKMFAALLALVALISCSTPSQQLANSEIKAANAQELKCGPNSPYLGSYNPNDATRLSPDTPYDSLSPELSETVALPFLSFLIIEPDPVTKNAVPSDIEKLVKARQFPEAITLINSRLKKAPKNVQLRFLKARIQLEMGDLNQAKQTLIEITQQFPELPEPYNNLAAISASQDKWIEARDYLELALKLRPSYAIASANLGEIYVRLGAKAYEEAAASTQLNQRLYTNRAKALMSIINKPNKTSNLTPTNNPPTNPAESKPKQ